MINKRVFNYIVGAALAFLFFACKETQVSTIYNERELSEYDSIILSEYITSKGIDVERTESGIYYDILKKGNTNIKVQDTSIVTFGFIGKVLYNDIFETSEYNGFPLSFQIHRTRDVLADSITWNRTLLEFESFRYNKEEIVDSTVVVRSYVAYKRLPGIAEAVSLMEEGDSTRFYIPSHLAWSGGTGGAPSIPAYSSIIVDISLRKVE